MIIFHFRVHDNINEISSKKENVPSMAGLEPAIP